MDAVCAPRDNTFMVRQEAILFLDPDQFGGGIAIWAAIPAALDSTPTPAPYGIHVHARESAEGGKVIDDTVAEVQLKVGSEYVLITREMAFGYRAARVFGLPMRHLRCTNCGHLHFDSGAFLLRLHQTHLCQKCGINFSDDVRSVGNPLVGLQHDLGRSELQIATSTRVINLESAGCSGGLRIWGTAPAIVWTSPIKEEYGIHVHGYSSSGERIVDDTFGRVTFGSLQLPVRAIDLYTVQKLLPQLQGKIQSMACPGCGISHLDDGPDALRPRSARTCKSCGEKFAIRDGQKVVCNPAVKVFESLASL